MNVSEAKRLKELETENARLKKLLAEMMLENEIAKEALRKKWGAHRHGGNWCAISWARGSASVDRCAWPA